MEIKIRVLTPLWTGGVDQRCDRIHETGLIGSLRWWYEALVRGLGGYACDPNNNGCEYEKDKDLSSICLACQIFGCTGYARRFRLVVDSMGDSGEPIEVKLKNPGNSKHKGWRIPPQLVAPISLRIQALQTRGFDDFDMGLLYHTISMIEKYGVLGAKASHGQGAFEVMDWGELSIKTDLKAWSKQLRGRPAKQKANHVAWPSLTNFIGQEITISETITSKENWWHNIPLSGLKKFTTSNDPSWLPTAPAVRAHLRAWLRDNKQIPDFEGDLRNERHRLMGTTTGNPKGSDIFVTHLYKKGRHWQMRVFAFIRKHGNAADSFIRSIIEDTDTFCREIETALGGLPVSGISYPCDMDTFLTEKKGS